VLEACCRSPVTLQRDLKRARIVLLAAAGHSTPVDSQGSWVQPRIVSQVEVWFSILQGQSLSGASFRSLQQLSSTSMPTSRRITNRLSHSSGPRKRSGNAASRPTYHSAVIPGTRRSIP
jgi:hypothetical protein